MCGDADGIEMVMYDGEKGNDGLVRMTDGS
jgi:hypothetical protein